MARWAKRECRADLVPAHGGGEQVLVGLAQLHKLPAGGCAFRCGIGNTRAMAAGVSRAEPCGPCFLVGRVLVRVQFQRLRCGGGAPVSADRRIEQVSCKKRSGS